MGLDIDASRGLAFRRGTSASGLDGAYQWWLLGSRPRAATTTRAASDRIDWKTAAARAGSAHTDRSMTAAADAQHSPPGHIHVSAGHPPPFWMRRAVAVPAALVVLLLYATGVVTSLLGVDTALIVAVVGAYPLLRRAIAATRARRLTFDSTIAVAALVAILTGQFLAAAEVVVIIAVGDAIEHWVIHRADRGIAALLSFQPPTARVVRDAVEQVVPAGDVRLTDTVVVRSGERLPVDGVVTGGEALVDQSSVTGEPLPVPKAAGAPVTSGTVVQQGALDVRPEHIGGDTTAARISRLVREARQRRPPIVRLADRLAWWFLPAIVVSAIAVYLLTGDTLRTVSVLLVGCSCALVYAAPAAFAAALARLGRRGVLVKGGDILERLTSVTVAAFDKTGTLTVGEPSVATIVAAEGLAPDDVLRFAAGAESRSEHCLGRAIVAEVTRRGLTPLPAEQFFHRPGLGVAARVAGRDVRVGSLQFIGGGSAEAASRAEALAAQAGRPDDCTVAVAIDGEVAGLVVLVDAPRPDAADAIRALRDGGIADVVMLTGDARPTALAIAAQVGIDPEDVYAQLLPADKLARIRELRADGAKLLMVGDGINDAPALAAADVGIAFGHGATDLSADAADVVVLDAALAAIPAVKAFARRTIRRVRFNILVFAIGVNVVAVFLAALGYLTAAAAAALHQVISVTVIASSVSLLADRRLRWASDSTPWYKTLATRFSAWIGRIGPPLAAVARRERRRLLQGAAGAVALAWLLSAVTVIGPGESGVVQRFGRLVDPALAPGLHLRAPWPIETVTRMRPREVRVLDIGFRSPATRPAGPVDYEWNTSHMAGGPVQEVPDENLVLTGDENLAELYAVVQYRGPIPPGTSLGCAIGRCCSAPSPRARCAPSPRATPSRRSSPRTAGHSNGCGPTPCANGSRLSTSASTYWASTSRTFTRPSTSSRRSATWRALRRTNW